MRSLRIIFICVFLLSFLFANVTAGGDSNVGVLKRAFICLIGSGVITLVLGLPICGLIYLFTN